MDQREPGTMSPVYWTRLPASALSGVRWDDHTDAHRAVMRLFPETLPGEAGARRAAAGILYRLQPGDDPTVLVQSLVPPDLIPLQAQVSMVPSHLWSIPTGAKVVARVALNPVRRHGSVARPVPLDELSDWLEARLGEHFTELDLLNVATSIGSGRSKGRPPSLFVATVDLLGEVRDGASFDQVRREGLGRSRAYGCGLLTARQLG